MSLAPPPLRSRLAMATRLPDDSLYLMTISEQTWAKPQFLFCLRKPLLPGFPDLLRAALALCLFRPLACLSCLVLSVAPATTHCAVQTPSSHRPPLRVQPPSTDFLRAHTHAFFHGLCECCFLASPYSLIRGLASLCPPFDATFATSSSFWSTPVLFQLPPFSPFPPLPLAFIFF